MAVTLDERFAFLFWSSIFMLMLLACYCGCACFCAIIFGAYILGGECCVRSGIANQIDKLDGK